MRQGERLVVPVSLKRQLTAFRGRVWTTKMLEAFALGIAVFLLAFLTVYCIDRFLDTPRSARAAIFAVSLMVWSIVPYALHRWVWKNRRLEQLARLLRVRESSIGDQLLSVIELAENDSEQARSRSLCAAAIEQVAASAATRDFTKAAPPTRLRSLTGVLLIAFCVTLGLALFFPAAAANAWARFTAPWSDTPRYTFTAVERLPGDIVVPHGEATPLSLALTQDSRWRPATATAQLGAIAPLQAQLHDGRYTFGLPPQVTEVPLTARVGDYYQTVSITPKLRPELVAAVASVKLPDYLERPESYEQDVRSGTLSVVEGASAMVRATASRELAAASIDGQGVQPEADSFVTQPLRVEGEPRQLKFSWEDHDGLAGRVPFELTVQPLIDELPTVVSQDLPRQAVILDSEQLNFQALAADDFGIKKIGLSWQGLDEEGLVPVSEGEKLISAGGPMNTSMQVPAVFSASALGISPQPIEVRLWAEDYMPGHERVYSPAHVFFVLTAEQHAIWITSQLSKWHRASLDVRDNEMQLFAANKRLREMTPGELADEGMRGELQRQAALETANARRLSSLTKTGEDLLRQAARNPEIGVGHLDRWAEMLQILNDIGGNRMPSVADLLGQASEQTQLARAGSAQAKPSKPSGPQAGKVRSSPPGGSNPSEEDEEVAANQPVLPQISDMESSVQPPDSEPSDSDGQPKKKKGNGSKLSLPTTTLAGPPPKPGEQPEEATENEEEEPMEQALFEQEELLAEFEKIADELNELLANLEGSTLVKRLKAASREQNQVALKIASRINAFFGTAQKLETEDVKLLQDLSQVEGESSQKISYIMDDMQSYYERRRMNQFKIVLDDMKESDVLLALQVLGEEIPAERGLSISQAEYWSDSLDRWAEDLVDPACSGQCPGSKTSDALPPSLILEVLKILEEEVNLREATRVAEQAKPAVELEQHEQEATKLSETQAGLSERTNEVVNGIVALPEGASRFGKEVELLSAVSQVMDDATQLLAGFDTGSKAMAAETEAIELLLQCKRINPKGGGGGGASPGGGGKGETQDSALALLGSGLNQNERREARDVTQATGESGRVLPEEYRAGLDEYFNRLEKGL